MTATVPNVDALTQLVVGARTMNLPDEVLEAAKMCLVDWCGVAIGARNELANLTTRRVVDNWKTQGNARILLGGTVAPGAAALINGTLAHCLDYDDTHVGSLAHLSGPIWATVGALGTHRHLDEHLMLQAFVTGFETGAWLGGGGMGEALNRRGWHSTGVFGCIGAVSAASVMLGLDERQTRNAFAVAATQTGGVTGSFGTMSKPFHAGKAAFNAILAAELAAQGFEARVDLLEPGGELARTLVQDASSTFPSVETFASWEILNNTFKPYASCLLTHPVIDAARRMSDRIKPESIERVSITVNSACGQLAGKTNPSTSLEGKFSTAFCAALGLTGCRAQEEDFQDARLYETVIRNLVARTTLHVDDTLDLRAAVLKVKTFLGEEFQENTILALGNPGNPMSWKDMQDKFEALVRPALGLRADELYDCLRNFGSAGSLGQFDLLVAAN
ncbi:MAG: 2-methylcitrate dehydratase [Rhodospirillaceae bacterium]|mgnify:CR=1 FL=1|nr:2-methylcitrate dehydratase [Rhodospirillaceae bacterium]